MHPGRYYLFSLILLLFSNGSNAQTTYTKGKEDKKGEINFTELTNYYRDHPTPLLKKPVIEEDEEEVDEPINRQEPDASLIRRLIRPAGRPIDITPQPSYLPASPAPTDSFLSTITNGTAIPPDTHGAVDSTYCVTAINTTVRIQKKNGTNVSNVPIDNFWSSMLTSGPGAFDPRVHYDPYAKRWIIVTLAYGQAANSQLMIGVSKTSNPTAGWWLYKITVDPTGVNWLDYPNVGFNNKWITVSGNFYKISSGANAGAVVYAFNKATMMTGAGAPYTKISPSGTFTICPALMYDSTKSNMFLVDVYNSTTGKLRLRKLSGPVGSPTLSAAIGYPTSSTPWASQNNGGVDFARQLGTTNKVQTGDNRITNFSYRNGKLWCAHTIFLPNTANPTRSSVMWWQIDTLANPVQNGKIDDPTGATFYAYPSIAVNQNDDALVGFAYMSAAVHPSAAYALHLHTDPADSMRPTYIYRHGQNTYYQTFSGTKNRWGDYSATCIDPSNNNDFWTLQESVPTTANSWDTWWAHVTVCEANSSFNLQTHTTTVRINDTVTFTGTAPTGSTYTWNFGGGIAVPGTGAGPHAVKWTTSGWKKITLTVTYGGCSSTFIDSVFVGNVSVTTVKNTRQNVKVIPNPNNGTFQLTFEKAITAPVVVKLLDMQGRLVYNNEFKTWNDNSVAISVNDLPSGIYSAYIEYDGELITEKITIDKQ